MYTNGNLFSHIIGQVDYDNFGISGIEKYFDKNLKNRNLLNQPLELTLDSNIQHIISKELNEAIQTFDASIGGALLMDVNNGDIISLVSLQIIILIRDQLLQIKNISTRLPKVFTSLVQF